MNVFGVGILESKNKINNSHTILSITYMHTHECFQLKLNLTNKSDSHNKIKKHNNRQQSQMVKKIVLKTIIYIT